MRPRVHPSFSPDWRRGKAARASHSPKDGETRVSERMFAPTFGDASASACPRSTDTHAWLSSCMALIFMCVCTEQNRLARSNDEHVMIRGPRRSRQAEQASAAQSSHSAAASGLELVPPLEKRCCWFLLVISCSGPQRGQCHHCLVADLNTRTLSLLFFRSAGCLFETNRSGNQSGNLNSHRLYAFTINANVAQNNDKM